MLACGRSATVGELDHVVIVAIVGERVEERVDVGVLGVVTARGVGPEDGPHRLAVVSGLYAPVLGQLGDELEPATGRRLVAVAALLRQPQRRVVDLEADAVGPGRDLDAELLTAGVQRGVGGQLADDEGRGPAQILKPPAGQDGLTKCRAVGTLLTLAGSVT